MGFFKELVDSFKEGAAEGLAEAREEVAAEAAVEAARTEGSNEDFFTRTPYDEQFGVALAAPFRETIFMDWFTIFKSEDLSDVFPRHLYNISIPELLEPSNVKEMKELLERDFEIVDETSALWAAGQLFTGACVPSEMEFPCIDGKEDTWADNAKMIYSPLHIGADDERKKSALTMLVNMAAHAVTMSANVGYISVETALLLLRDLGVFTKSLYGKNGSWEEYGEMFLAANDIFELNKKAGMKVLRKNVENLCERPGSPWRNVPFIAEGETPVAFDELVTPPNFAVVYDEEEFDTIEAHIMKHFGDFKTVFHEIVSPDVHMDVVNIEPCEKVRRRLLVTFGAGAHFMNVPDELHDNDLYRIELLMVLPEDWDMDSEKDEDYWPIGSLKAMGRYALVNDTWLGWGHTVQFGKESFPPTDFEGYLVAFPMIADKESRVCTLPDGTDVNFYQLIPLTLNEMEYKINNGTEALLEKFYEAFGKDYDGVIDPKRQEVV
jgi:hypothetical protein